MMTQQNFINLLEECGHIRHILNIISSNNIKHIFLYKTEYGYNIEISYDGDIDSIYLFDDNYRYLGNGKEEFRRTPLKFSYKSRRKLARKFYTAIYGYGGSSVAILEILEKKNQHLRKYMWEVMNKDQNP